MTSLPDENNDEIVERLLVSQTIREYVGIDLLMKTNAKGWHFLDKNRRGVQFDIANKHIEIVLNSFNTYNISAFQNNKLIKQYKDIYCDQLAEIVYGLVDK